MYNKNKKNNPANTNAKDEINIALVGPAGCGKSALLVKYITKRFIGEYYPFYEGCWSKLENIDGVDVNINIMDTYDKERTNLEKYLKWSDALVLVYSITSSQSFFVIQEYLENVHEILKRITDDPNEKNDKPQIKIILLGNKIDLERYRQVNKQDVEIIIEKYLNYTKSNDLTSSLNSETINLNIVHMESTSCDEYELVQNLFHKIVRDVRRDRDTYFISNPLVINEESSTNSEHVKLNSSFKQRFNSSPAFMGSKRSKSPKPNVNNVVEQTVSVSPPANPSPNLVSFQSSKKNKFPFFNKILNKS